MPNVTSADQYPARTAALYLSDNGIFFKSDCLDLLQGIKTDSIDLCFTDPPFNLGKYYADKSFTDRIETEKYFQWCKAWLSELIRVLKPGGSLFVYQMPRWALEIGAWLNQRDDVSYRNLIALKMKSFPMPGRLQPATYTILYYTKKGREPTFNIVRHRMPVCRFCGKEIPDYGGYRSKFKKFEDEEGVPWIQISDFWEDTRPARHDKARQNLVNELPLHVPERVILMASRKDDVVLDIFGGGGSTYHAAQMHGRLWIGCEIGNSKPCLNRFVTLWGKTEASAVNDKLSACFNENFLSYYMSKKTSKKVQPIKTAKALHNAKAISNGNVVSKSKTFGD